MAARCWRLIDSGPGEPAHNMAVDRALLASADSRPVLRLYGWSPAALSLGYFQPVEPFVALAREAGLVLVRRPTGGGAIHHDQELTFGIVATPGRDGYPAAVIEAYEWVHAVLVDALARVGVTVHLRGGDAPLSVRPRTAGLCFADITALDLVDIDGRKLVGSAQRRTGGRVLHHGSIPLEVPALTPGSSSVALRAGRAVARDELAEIVAEVFATRVRGSGLLADTLNADELREAERLAPGCRLAQAGGPA